tara:strand:- start:3985 stop:4347 length:363 start_codon:yes stop_codon:yes gene_type:complete
MDNRRIATELVGLAERIVEGVTAARRYNEGKFVKDYIYQLAEVVGLIEEKVGHIEAQKLLDQAKDNAQDWWDDYGDIEEGEDETGRDGRAEDEIDHVFWYAEDVTQAIAKGKRWQSVRYK